MTSGGLGKGESETGPGSSFKSSRADPGFLWLPKFQVPPHNPADLWCALSALSPNSFTVKEVPEGKNRQLSSLQAPACETSGVQDASWRLVETSLPPRRRWGRGQREPRIAASPSSARQAKKRGATEGRARGAGGAKAAGSARMRTPRRGVHPQRLRTLRASGVGGGGGALRLVVRVGRGRAGTAAEARTGDWLASWLRHRLVLIAGRWRDPFGRRWRRRRQRWPGSGGTPWAKAMAPRLQLEKAAWRWAETVRPEEVSQEHIETAYRIWLEPCIRGVCRWGPRKGTRAPPRAGPWKTRPWGSGGGGGGGSGWGGEGRRRPIACLSQAWREPRGGLPPLRLLGDPGKAQPCRAVHGGDDAGSPSEKVPSSYLEDGGGDGWKQELESFANVGGRSILAAARRLVLENWELVSVFHHCLVLVSTLKAGSYFWGRAALGKRI